jgi:hypothetical protein
VDKLRAFCFCICIYMETGSEFGTHVNQGIGCIIRCLMERLNRRIPSRKRRYKIGFIHSFQPSLLSAKLGSFKDQISDMMIYIN